MAEAEAVVLRLEAASDRTGAATRHALPAATLPTQVPVPQRERGRWSELLSPAYRGRTLIVWVLWGSAFLIANSLNNWMPTLYTTVYHLDLPQALRAASMTNVAQVALVLLCAMVIDRTGRKYWMMGCFGLGAVMLGVLAIRRHAGGVVGDCFFSTLSYGLVGSIAAVGALSVYARDLSDPDARDRNRCRYLVAPDRFGDRADADRIHARQGRRRFRCS